VPVVFMICYPNDPHYKGVDVYLGTDPKNPLNKQASIENALQFAARKVAELSLSRNHTPPDHAHGSGEIHEVEIVTTFRTINRSKL
jgi:hypothetical protein